MEDRQDLAEVALGSLDHFFLAQYSEGIIEQWFDAGNDVLDYLAVFYEQRDIAKPVAPIHKLDR